MKNRYVNVGDGAMMAFPSSDFCHQMRYGVNSDTSAAAAMDSYRYLVLHCTKEESWRRIKIIRESARVQAMRNDAD